MGIVTPPGFLQNAGSVHTAEILRNHGAAMFNGARAASSLVPRGGVHPALGGQCAVTQQGSPTMGVTVATGLVYVPGTEGATQGTYSCMVSSTTNLTVTAANATLPRIDTVVATVRDTAYSGANNDWLLQVIAGTAASSPVAPTIPNDSIALANISVAAAATQIVNANITDQRSYVGMGIIPVRTFSALPSPAYKSMYAYTLDTNILYFYDGTTWQPNSERYTPVCHLIQPSGQTQSGWTNGAATAVTFGTGSTILDTEGAHSESTNISRVVIGKKLGWWKVSGVYCPASGNAAATQYRAVIGKNGTPIPGSFGEPAGATTNFVGVTTPTVLVQATSSSDYVELMGVTVAGSGTIGTSTSSPYVNCSIYAEWTRP